MNFSSRLQLFTGVLRAACAIASGAAFAHDDQSVRMDANALGIAPELNKAPVDAMTGRLHAQLRAILAARARGERTEATGLP